MTALFLLTAIAGCTFEPSGQLPGDGTPVDGRLPPDGRLPIDARVATDGRLPIDGPPGEDVDATVSRQRRKQITIDRTRVRTPPGGPLASFPVLFAVDDPDIAGRASADGSDIYFVAADGETRLDHEIEKWNQGTGELVAWVKLPSLPSSEDTVFYVYYGDPAAANPVPPANVWTSSFAAVWHLAERPRAVMVDSTTGNDGAAHSSMQPNDQVPGQIGDGIDFDGVDDEITFENPIAGTTPHTISVWVNQRATTSQDAVVVLGNGEANRARWLHSVYFGNTVAVGFYANDWDIMIDIRNDGWRLLHWTYTNRDNVFYVDGAPAGTLRVGPGIDTQGSEGRLGNASAPFGANMNLNGQLDEVRIATVVRPPEWIQTEFNNQSDPSSFYTVGPETR
jgi:MSHA biogenesis protein MshQ